MPYDIVQCIPNRLIDSSYDKYFICKTFILHFFSILLTLFFEYIFFKFCDSKYYLKNLIKFRFNETLII